MIKVMIVDDEEIVHLGLHALTDWENYGFSLCYDAANGHAALEMLAAHDDIQIVLMDLQMPKMDGMQFLEEINRNGLMKRRGLEVIVLSAYDRYDLIRQAFRLGVSDYIVKFEMSKDEILKQLQNAAKRLVKPQSEKNEAAQKTDLSAYTYFSVAVVLLDSPSEFNDKPVLRSIVKDLATQELYVDITDITETEASLTFAFKAKSKSACEHELEAVLRKLNSYLQNYMNLHATIGAGHVIANTVQLNNQHAIARQNADMRFVLGRRKIIFPRDTMGIVSRDIGSIAGLSRKLIAALRAGDDAALATGLDAVFVTIAEYNPEKIDKIYPYYFELLFSVMLYLDEIGATAEDIFRRNVNFYEEIHKCKTRDELNSWISNVVGWIAEYLKDKSGGASRPVNMARDFITRNYFDKTLSLRMVSSYVGISESHLSSIFAKQTGKNFTEYVTEMRIDQAKKLLKETNLKVYEIAENVGFANAEYFSKIFKKVTGKSPNQFMQKSN